MGALTPVQRRWRWEINASCVHITLYITIVRDGARIVGDTGHVAEFVAFGAGARISRCAGVGLRVKITDRVGVAMGDTRIRPGRTHIDGYTCLVSVS